jgi:hypothetical protein
MAMHFKSLYAFAFLLCSSVGLAAVEEREVDFNRDIRPILSDKCFHCHGPDEEARKAHLRLDIIDEKEGPFRIRGGSQAIKPGDLQASAVWYRLTTLDEDDVMPPKESHKKPLTDSQKALIKQWILQGAEYQDFWAFVPPSPRTAPAVGDSAWSLNRIDRFVMARLEKEGLKPQARADRRTLIRRVTFDLTGLPPTRDEVQRFIQDTSEDAYEKLIDRLMASPQYGEHMAKYWLDLVRFADTNGMHHDHYREMTPYRDWVIRAFNENLSFDKFTSYQIAGDLYEKPSLDQKIASGFNRLHLVIDRGTAIPKESFTRNVVDRVTAVGTAFMGLTVQCAVCHDHKYDPITQKDFYQLFAFFNNIDAEPEAPGSADHAPFIRLPTADQDRRLRSVESGISKAMARVQTLKDALGQLQADGETKAELDEERQVVESALKVKEEELGVLEEEKKQLEGVIPVSLVMKERSDVRPAHILIRGVYDQPGEEVTRNTPAFLSPIATTGDVPSRMDLVRWLTDDKNPLTARVAANRFWQQLFGVGLVKTSENFGAQGEWPSHPGLLDDLAIHFVKSQWDVKALIKSIVNSQTYQQSSRTQPAAFRADPDNRLLSRGSRFRLDSEMIRDQILFVSGLLNQTMYGRSVKPPQPPNLWKTISMVTSTTYSFKADTGGKVHRRSLYSFWKRALPPPQMTIFDAPTRESCIARRERTNTPLQALVLMNEGQYFHAARLFAQQVLGKVGMSEEERLGFAYESVTSHLPDVTELVSLRKGLRAFRGTYRDDVPSARVIASDVKAASDEQRIEIAAYTMLVNSLFNLDVAKTRE